MHQNALKAMCIINNSANRFHILDHFYDEESEESGDDSFHSASPICIGDFLAIAEDMRGVPCKKVFMKKG
jgi:hypothetical protein